MSGEEQEQATSLDIDRSLTAAVSIACTHRKENYRRKKKEARKKYTRDHSKYKSPSN